MTTTVSPLLRKLLAVTLLVALVYGAWTGVLIPLREDMESYEQTLENNTEFLARYVAHATARPELDGELARLRKIEASQGGFLKADNAALAAAALQDRLKRVITKTGGTLKSVQVLAPEADGNYRRVSVDIMVTAEAGPLKDLLHDLETGMPYLFVDEMDIRRTATRSFAAAARGRPAPEGAPTEEPLQVRLKVSGFMRGAGT